MCLGWSAPSCKCAIGKKVERYMEVNLNTPPRRLAFGDLRVGDEITEKRTFTRDMLALFSSISDDTAPLHDDPEYAKTMGFETIIVQGLLVASPFSRMLGMYLPGERTLLVKVEFKYRQPTLCGQELLYKVRIDKVRPSLKVVQLSLSVSANESLHLTGNAQCVIVDNLDRTS